MSAAGAFESKIIPLRSLMKNYRAIMACKMGKTRKYCKPIRWVKPESVTMSKFVLAQQQYKIRHRKVMMVNPKIIFEICLRCV
jgi:hypothetical protein